MSDWIHVSERLPEDNENVLVTTWTKYGNEIDIAMYVSDVFKWYHEYSAGSPRYAWIKFYEDSYGSVFDSGEISDPVIAWMPLPKPYKEEE